MLNQIEIFDIPSPCKRVCETDPQGYCLSCFRSREERFNWLKLNSGQKREVLRLCRQRRVKRRYYLNQQALQRQIASSDSNIEQLDLF